MDDYVNKNDASRVCNFLVLDLCNASSAGDEH
jgi:hypothetical protein